MSTDFKQLEQNITSTIYEGLLKLGYSKNECFSIYYDLDLLNHLLDTHFISNEECFTALQEFSKNLTTLDTVTISLEKKRFKFTVQSHGIERIYQLYEQDNYLKHLINLVKTHNFTLQDILSIFELSDHEYILEDSKNEEFQHVIYLKDSQIDPYRYCFTFDQMGGYYHRLLPYDYEKLEEHTL